MDILIILGISILAITVISLYVFEAMQRQAYNKQEKYEKECMDGYMNCRKMGLIEMSDYTYFSLWISHKDY